VEGRRVRGREWNGAESDGCWSMSTAGPPPAQSLYLPIVRCGEQHRSRPPPCGASHGWCRGVRRGWGPGM